MDKIKKKKFHAVCCFIVTYGNRLHFLFKVLERLQLLDVKNIVIVNNGLTQHAKEQLKDAIGKFSWAKITIVSFASNVGSAKGFSRGIKEALKTKCRFIWMLDDDLLPNTNALEEMLSVWDEIDIQEKEYNLILFANREDKKLYTKALLLNNPNIVIGYKNQFRSLHVGHLFSSVYVKYTMKNIISQRTNVKFGEIASGYFGGMFFHRNLIDRLVYPNEDFVLYMDDVDFTYRNKITGGRNVLVLSSLIHDLEESWNASKKNSAIFQIALWENFTKLYYSIRNRVYFERVYTTNNTVIYFINMVIYSSLVIVYALLQGKIKNIKVYCEAVRDGIKKKLGVNSKYPLN